MFAPFLGSEIERSTMAERDAGLTAQLILEGFIDYRKQFQGITCQAPAYFVAADWLAMQCIATERIDLYEVMIRRVANQLAVALGKRVDEHALWIAAKRAYSALIKQRNDTELGETFYNSVYCRLLEHLQITNEHIFIQSQATALSSRCSDGIYRKYELAEGLVPVLKKLLEDYQFAIPWENPRRDIRNLLRYIRQNIPAGIKRDSDTRIEVIRSVFFRNKAAYIVGRVCFSHQAVPFVLPVLNNERGGVYIDAALSEENDVSIVFSFTRAYFMVDVDVPAEFIAFLHSLIPMKTIAELYSSIGFYKQGKAEFYRAFIGHLESSADQFEIAPGTKGMVMTVFTLPSYPVVFKIIKDTFSSSKQVTRAGVIEKYQLVKRHDRAGRMADTQEFVNLTLPRERFSESLLTELNKVASKAIELKGGEVIIHHLWTERRMIPLNIYLNEMIRQENEQAIYLAINEFGKCIKELAAANIFAGDMLFKNFGVTRHGRVVFYDYDEILYLTECNFRDIPEPLYPEQELASEPWYSVAANDVFPEEFTILTACDRRIRKIFNELHGDLLSAGWWRQVQAQVVKGEIIDLFPYRKRRQFDRGNKFK